jgi:hypothetical protein
MSRLLAPDNPRRCGPTRGLSREQIRRHPSTSRRSTGARHAAVARSPVLRIAESCLRNWLKVADVEAGIKTGTNPTGPLRTFPSQTVRTAKTAHVPV